MFNNNQKDMNYNNQYPNQNQSNMNYPKPEDFLMNQFSDLSKLQTQQKFPNLEEQQIDPQNFMYNQMNNKMNMMPNQNKGNMREVDYFMNNIMNNIACNQINSIPPNSIQAIQKMIESQNEGNPGITSALPLNANTNNPELNNVSNIANNFGKIVEAINTFNTKHINHNNNVVSTVNNLTGVLTNNINEQEKLKYGEDGNLLDEDKKDESKFFFIILHFFLIRIKYDEF